jgi:hypothetical protein
VGKILLVQTSGPACNVNDGYVEEHPCDVDAYVDERTDDDGPVDQTSTEATGGSNKGDDDDMEAGIHASMLLLRWIRSPTRSRRVRGQPCPGTVSP